MKKFLKENWFVIVVGVLFVSIAIVFTIDQNKDNLPGKKVNGEDIVFSINDQNYSANNVYDLLAVSQKKSAVLYNFYKSVINQKANFSESEDKALENQATNVINYYIQSGYTQDYLDSVAQYYYGYNTFREYVIYANKFEKIANEYIKAHFDEVFTNEMQEKLKPRIVSYVVITFADPKNPTAEEKEKLERAQQAWASGDYTEFSEFAKAFSEDSASSQGGKFGYIDTTDTSVDTVFKDTATSLQEGQVSDWTFSETFGYYLIKCDSTKVDDFKDEPVFVDSVLAQSDDLSKVIFWDAVESLDVKFNDAEVEKAVNEAYNPAFEKEESEVK